MVRRRISTLTLAALTMVTPVGCRCFQKRCDTPAREGAAPRDTEPGVIPPRGSTIPPPGVPSTPDGARRDTFAPTRPSPRLETPVEPVSPFDLPKPVESESKKLFDPALPKGGGKSPKSDDQALPSDGVQPKKLLMPERMPDTPDKPKDTQPESKYPPKEEGTKPGPDRNVLLDPVAPGGPIDLPKTRPTVVEEREPLRHESKATPKPETPPVGLSDFQVVKGKVNLASGQKPTLDGYEWLAKSGYKTVAYAHDPAADVSAAKAVCEAAGLKFVGIPTGPDTIPTATAAFDAAVASAKDTPLYVCDDTGLRAATLWYAHFRKVDLLSPDAAKVRANGLGLGDTDANPDQKKLWDAAQLD